MIKCPVCQKQKAEIEMRPLIDVKELTVGNTLSEQKSQKEIGGVTLDLVCRGCWATILASKEKDEIIEMLETICAILFEVNRVEREKVDIGMRGVFGGMPGMIEKHRPTPDLNPTPWQVPQTLPGTVPETVIGSGSPMWVIGNHSIHLDHSRIIQMARTFSSMGLREIHQQINESQQERFGVDNH